MLFSGGTEANRRLPALRLLVAAAACGLCMAFVARPTEHGQNQRTSLRPEHAFDVSAESFIDLAEQLGC